LFFDGRVGEEKGDGGEAAEQEETYERGKLFIYVFFLHWVLGPSGMGSKSFQFFRS